jgi:peptide/nickel transport system permease protein
VITFAIRRLLVAIPTLLLASLLMFTILYQVGDPIGKLRGQKIDAEEVGRLLRENGFDKPFHERYWHWLSGFVRGDWGTSFQSNRSVFREVMDRMPATLELLGAALVVTLLIAVPVGVLGARFRYSLFDNLASGLSYLGFATPTFFLGLMLQLMAIQMKETGWGVILLVIGITLVLVSLRRTMRRSHWTLAAVGGVVAVLGVVFFRFHQGDLFLNTAQRTTAYEDNGLLSLDHLRHLVLPVMTITLISIATWSRYLRSSMIDVLNQDYLRTARAKGLSERRVIYRHAMRNAMIPLITIMAIDAAALFQGAIVTETVFAWPGIGSTLITAVKDQNIPVAMAIVMIGATMVVLFNLVADVAYSIADPRIRLS